MEQRETAIQWAVPLFFLLLTALWLVTDPAGTASAQRQSAFDLIQRTFAHQETLPELRPLLVPPHSTPILRNWAQTLHRDGVRAVVLTDETVASAAPAFVAAGIPTIQAVNLTQSPKAPAFRPDGRLTHGLKGEGRSDPFSVTPDFSGIQGAQGETYGYWMGAANLFPDADGVVRRAPLVMRVQGYPILSLSAQVWRMGVSHAPLTLARDTGKITLQSRRGADEARVGAVTMPVAPDGSFTIAYSWSLYDHTLPATALIAGTKPESLRNTILFVGMSDMQVRTPHGLRPVAVVQAAAANSLLLDHTLQRPDYLPVCELVVLLLLGGLLISLFCLYGLQTAALTFLACSLCVILTTWLLYIYYFYQVNPRGIVLGLTMTLAGCVLAIRYQIFLSRRIISRCLNGKIPSAAVRNIAHKRTLSFAPQIRPVTYLSCGWLMVGVPTPENKDSIQYRVKASGVIGEIIMAHGGTLDAITGDEITAMWNAPQDDPQAELHACQAADAILNAIGQLHRKPDGLMQSFGIGICSGDSLAAGFSTSAGTWGYSVGGLCVRRAKLLRQICYRYGYSVLTCETVQKSAGEKQAFLEVDFIPLGPMPEPIHIFAMPGGLTLRANPRLRAQATFHDEIFAAIRNRQWNKARTLIAQCRKLSGASAALYDLHIARIEAWEQDPPGPDWDGAFRSPTG